MVIQPIGERLLILPDPELEAVGSIQLADVSKERPCEGAIVARGLGLADVAVFAPGSKVLYPKFAGTEIEIDGEEYLFLRSDEILGIVQAGGEMPRHKPKRAVHTSVFVTTAPAEGTVREVCDWIEAPITGQSAAEERLSGEERLARLRQAAE